MRNRITDNNGMVIACYHTSWQFTWDCICVELGIEEF